MSERDVMLRRPVVLFFLLTFGITWGLAACFLLFPGPLIAAFGKPSLGNPLFVLAVYAPVLSALALSFAEGGVKGVGALVGRLFRWRFGLPWYAAIFLGLPLLAIAAHLIDSLATGTALPAPLWQLGFNGPDGVMMLKQFQSEGFSALPLIIGLMFVTDPGPLGEELGWRGFALPRMIAGGNWVVPSLVLGVIWGLWHLPAFFISGTPQSALSLPMFLVGVVAVSVLIAFVFVGTRGSVLAAALMHFMSNICVDSGHLPFTYYLTGVLVAAAVVVAVLGRNMDVRAASRA